MLSKNNIQWLTAIGITTILSACGGGNGGGNNNNNTTFTVTANAGTNGSTPPVLR